MAKFRYQHIKSSVEGKAPTAEQIKVAEIGVNDFAGDEKLFIKNSAGEVVDFPRGYSQAVIDENERVTAEALNDLNSRKLDASAYTPTDLSNYYTKDETSGKTEIQDALDDKADTATTYTKTEVDARDLWVSGTGTSSVAQKGGNNTASGSYSHAEGLNTTASGNYSHAEGQSTTASGYNSHAEGYTTTASGSSSHAEGGYTKASGNYSHAEGYSTTASGQSSHAEGYTTTASGNYSHAEGSNTVASGSSSHAEGYYTITLNNSEHASGQYNVSNSASTTFGDSGNTLFSVGNGATDNARHNAFEIKQNGDIYITSGNTDVKLQDSIPSVDGYADSVKYNSTTHFVEFYHGTTAGTKVFEYDASPFLIDGMVENVEIEDVEISGETVTCLVISFNTAAGKQDINIPLTEIFDPNVYYTKTEVDTALAGKVSTSDVDQVIDSTTSASTGAVSTSAVYGFVTSYTPSITVDQVLDNTTSASTNPVSSKAVYDAVTDNELVWTNAFVTLSGVISSHTENTDIHVTAADKTAWNAKVDASAIADFFDDAKYEDSGTTKVINFYHGNTIKATIDASDFIVDGMVDDVRIENGNLVIDFNTVSGKQDISIPLTDIFDPSNYYDKDDIDDLVGSGFTSSSITDVIIENEEIVSSALTDLDERKLDATAYTPTDLSDYYTKEEIDEQQETVAASLNDLEDRKIDTAEFEEAQEVVTAALNDLEDRKANEADVEEIGETVAYALNDLECRKADKDEFDDQFETISASLNDLENRKANEADVEEAQETIAASLNDLESRKANKLEDLDGIKLKKITQSDYDDLVSSGATDSNTLYIITD